MQTGETTVQTFTSSDGLTIAYREWPGEADAPPVLLHHGFAVDAVLNWVYPGLVGALTAAGRRVVAVDARGHGASAKPSTVAHYGERRMAEDVATLVELLGVAEIDLVGYSMGAIVSLLVAADQPWVRRLVVGGIGAAVVELGGVETRGSAPGELAAALRAADPVGLRPVVATFRAFADQTGADRFALALQAEAFNTDPIPLDRITAPTLLLAGDSDPLATRPEVLRDAIPDARLLVLPGDHLSVVGHPEFTRAVTDFVS
ncbi:alpha/beta fold hydrolase [Goodfellowiella coeruleoviolacea]|uniref:Lysophospholipase, alpha-beta hydrolase superfamily n=1 Tax=Goodfellowiella coeruleoviolacea TaxID=334858 RepID=A0AAE3GJI7_9PSEU|nr:alpha/beta hydrolase [Goodfellowiella coeruleoviolacea]MCP2168693.1 Lysophospholipase, alpha-beta hydrolase superfamily [Goodfellowiella coeruleoviolacea]